MSLVCIVTGEGLSSANVRHIGRQRPHKLVPCGRTVIHIPRNGMHCPPPKSMMRSYTKGQQAGHADAGEIAEVIGPRTAELVDIPPELGRMGLGEAAVLSLYVERRGSAGNEDSIVSDDRQFLRYLQRREQRERVVIRRLNTSQFIAESAVSGLMTKPQAMEALTKIINRVPDQHYNFAIQHLELL